MEETLKHYSELVPTYMSVVALLVVILEWIALTILKKVERHKEGGVNIVSAALTYIPIFITNTFITAALMFLMYQYRFFNLGFEWYVWVLAYVGYDFMSYALHWLSHKVRFFWCIHSVHHSPKEMKASVSFRGSFAEFIMAPHLILWLPLLGFHPFMIIIVEGIGQLYGVILHLNEHFAPRTKRLKLERLIVTPSMHRLHHANNELYLDTNYGLMFSIWDYVFGTFQKEVKHEKPVYGLMKEINSENLLIAQTDEFVTLWKDIKSAPRFTDKLKYLFMPPGWNHTDGGETAHTIRQRALSAPTARVLNGQ